MERIYLDYAATTPVDTEVLHAMQPYFSEDFGNPNSLHSFGQSAQAALDRARETVAHAIGAGFRDVIFNGSATEANNLVLRGTVKQFLISNSQSSTRKPKIIISAVEHESVRETAEDLRKDGVDVVEIPVDNEGVVDLARLEHALDDRTILVSVMYANNEMGAVQPIAKISEIIKNFRETTNHKQKTINYPLFHTDAVQAFQYLPCDVAALGVDLMTLSAHKLYGPKGVGVLYEGTRSQELGASKAKRSGPRSYILAPTITGGNQEFGVRAGTQNVPLAIGCAVAVARASELQSAEAKRMRELGFKFWDLLKKEVPGIELNGVPGTDRGLPNIWNVFFPTHCARDLVVRLDMEGIAISAGAACSSRSTQESRVLAAMGLHGDRVKNSVRFSFGRGMAEKTIAEAVKRIGACIRESTM